MEGHEGEGREGEKRVGEKAGEGKEGTVEGYPPPNENPGYGPDL